MGPTNAAIKVVTSLSVGVALNPERLRNAFHCIVAGGLSEKAFVNATGVASIVV
jgi:hypothetical protein